ncbi:MAG: hypothetical protein JO200_15460 [Comamonas sp.]|nr:hypothetical protein [Comamonas sp.]
MNTSVLHQGGARHLRAAAKLGLLPLGGSGPMAEGALAQVAKEGAAALPEVQVKGQALDAAQRAFSVTVLGRDEIGEQSRQEVESLWNQVPACISTTTSSAAWPTGW